MAVTHTADARRAAKRRANVAAKAARRAAEETCTHTAEFCVLPGEIVRVAGRLAESTGWVYCPRCQTVTGEL